MRRKGEDDDIVEKKNDKKDRKKKKQQQQQLAKDNIRIGFKFNLSKVNKFIFYQKAIENY